MTKHGINRMSNGGRDLFHRASLEKRNAGTTASMQSTDAESLVVKRPRDHCFASLCARVSGGQRKILFPMAVSFLALSAWQIGLNILQL